VLNRITFVRDIGKVFQREETIDGVILNVGRQKVLIYTGIREIEQQLFRAYVAIWRLQLLDGATKLLLNLYPEVG
jgi:hypothetical protein